MPSSKRACLAILTLSVSGSCHVMFFVAPLGNPRNVPFRDLGSNFASGPTAQEGQKMKTPPATNRPNQWGIQQISHAALSAMHATPASRKSPRCDMENNTSSSSQFPFSNSKTASKTARKTAHKTCQTVSDHHTFYVRCVR